MSILIPPVLSGSICGYSALIMSATTPPPYNKDDEDERENTVEVNFTYNLNPVLSVLSCDYLPECNNRSPMHSICLNIILCITKVSIDPDIIYKMSSRELWHEFTLINISKWTDTDIEQIERAFQTILYNGIVTKIVCKQLYYRCKHIESRQQELALITKHLFASDCIPSNNASNMICMILLVAGNQGPMNGMGLAMELASPNRSNYPVDLEECYRIYGIPCDEDDVFVTCDL